MRPTVKVVTLTSVFAIAGSWGFDRIGVVVAQEEFPPAKSARGDILAKTAQHQFEVFFYPTGVRVLPQPAAGGPVNVSCTAGTATFHHPNSLEPWFSRPLRGTPTSPGQAPESLDLAINLSNAPTTGARVTFVLSGLTNTA